MKSTISSMLFVLLVLFEFSEPQCFAQSSNSDAIDEPKTIPAKAVTSISGADLEAAVSQANLLSQAFRDAANRVIPATVKVETTLRSSDSPMNRMFPFESPPRRRMIPSEGLGTGIIIDPKGIVLTNNHVVEDAKDIKVLLSDGREYEVTNRKADKESDLALLTIKPEESLPSVKFANSDTIDVGDWVVAVGNPFNFESTVSVGIISARWRTIGDVQRGDFLQTDAAINPGNSGGPLLNLRGEVVGINTAIVSQTGSNSGVGFAIASNTASWVAEQLAAKGKVDRAYLGVGIEMVDAKRAATVGAKPREGVYVKSVREKTPAKDAGVKANDIILTFDGRNVNSPPQLQSTVERSDLEKEHEITVYRDKEIIKLPIKVAILPKSLLSSGSVLGDQPAFHRDALGLFVITLNNSEQYSYESSEGVVVIDVTRGSLAANAGLEKRMLITKVDDKPVKNTDEYIAVRKESSLENGVKFNVESEDGPKEITIKRGKKDETEDKKSDEEKTDEKK
ncbi:MAG: trypsin-like peptidase domain-containing protein [Planctomycetaceae bacterium]|jgi:serine protease Do|nr:trypsin-like peptidase domain-containing protein [Planctomycetaceae bacterium]